jgi:hypothetical protein
MSKLRPAAFLALALATLAVLPGDPAAAAPVAVRYAESITHAFLTIREADGDVLAHGELVQAPGEKHRWDSRLTFRFKDGSLWDEKITFTQNKVFRLMSYHHVERGPSFPEAMEVSFDRDTGRYRARVDDKTDEGQIELPEDLHNGMTLTMLKNLPPGTVGAGHILAFTPKPHRLVTELRAEGEDKYVIGNLTRTATRYLLKMDLKGLTGVVASLIGKDPPDLRYWVTTGPAPAFLKLEGPMFMKGPKWRIEFAPPARWAER